MKRNRIRSLTSILVIGVAMSATVACGGGDSAEPSSDSSATETETTETETTDEVPTEVPATEAPGLAIDRVVAPEASTVTDLLALDRPVVIVHAGGDFDYPHSTMYAYTESALGGADVLEMDVMLSADGVLMVQHDNTVDRLTNDTGLVSSYTAAELQAMDNAYWFSGGVWSDKSLPEDAYTFRGVRTGDRPAPEGYTADVMYRWGDPILASAPAFKGDASETWREQEVQAGDNHDGINFFPFPGTDGSSRGILAMNHEYINAEYIHNVANFNKPEIPDNTKKQLAAHGVSVIEVQRNAAGKWEYVKNSTYNRRITGYTPISITGPAAGNDLLKTAADATGTEVLGLSLIHI